MVTTETSIEPPPIFTSNLPERESFFIPMPTAEASDSSIRQARPAPAAVTTSRKVRLSSPVAPLGIDITTFGFITLFLKSFANNTSVYALP